MYSIAFSKNIEIIFSNLDLINMDELKEFLDSKQSGKVNVVSRALSLDLKDGSIAIVGHKIRENTWIISEDRVGELMIIKHDISDEQIRIALGYTYHMCNNLWPATVTAAATAAASS